MVTVENISGWWVVKVRDEEVARRQWFHDAEALAHRLQTAINREIHKKRTR